MAAMKRKLLLFTLGATLLLSGGGKVVYRDDTKLVIGCDDNRTSLMVQKEADGYRYEGEYFSTIEEIAAIGCR